MCVQGRLEGEVLSLQMGIAAAKTAAADAVAAAKAKASSPRRTPAEPYIDLSDGISTPSTGTLGRSGTTIPPVSVSPPQSHASGVSATVSPTSADRRRVHFSPHDHVRLIPTAVENAANQYVSPVGEDDSPVTPAKAAVDDPAKLLMVRWLSLVTSYAVHVVCVCAF